MEIEPTELPRLRLGAGPWLLVEPPFAAVVSGLDMLVDDLQRRGYRVVLAHPERCPAFHRDPPDAWFARARGRLDLDHGRLAGRPLRRTVRRFALDLARDELIHNVTSDAHDTASRPPGIRSGLRDSGLEPLSEWLTEGVPAAILAGDEIPSRPAMTVTPHTSSAWWRRRR